MVSDAIPPPDTFEAWSYRDADQPLRGHRHALLRRRRGELESLPPALVKLAGARLGRTAAGAAGIAGAACVLLAAIFGKGLAIAGLSTPALPLTPILVGAVACALAAWIAGRAAGRRWIGRRLARELVSTDDVFADVARLERRTLSARAAELADGLERRSVAWPMIACSLLAPLTLHLMIYASLARESIGASFDWWIGCSLVLVLPAHGVLAYFSWRFARELRTWTPGSTHRLVSWAAAYGWTCVAGLVPGVVLFGIPPALVALTGVVIVPAMFSIMRGSVLDERRVIESANG